MMNSTRVSIVVVVLAQSLAGCGGPSTRPTQPNQPPTRPQPIVTRVTPNVGFTGGGTLLTIIGTGFDTGFKGEGPIVMIGGTSLDATFDPRDPPGTILYINSPPHAAGMVDVIVTNFDGQSATLAGGYTYESPDSFDFSGEWEGGAQSGHVLFRFTIRNGQLLAVSCDTATLLLSAPVPVRNGKLSFSDDNGVTLSGQFVTRSEAIGFITLAPCAGSDWYATRQ